MAIGTSPTLKKNCLRADKLRAGGDTLAMKETTSFRNKPTLDSGSTQRKQRMFTPLDSFPSPPLRLRTKQETNKEPLLLATLCNLCRGDPSGHKHDRCYVRLRATPSSLVLVEVRAVGDLAFSTYIAREHAARAPAMAACMVPPARITPHRA